MNAQPQTQAATNGTGQVPQSALDRAYIVGHFLATDAMRTYLGLQGESTYPPGDNRAHLRHYFHPAVIKSRKAGFADACQQMRIHVTALQHTYASQPAKEAQS